MMDVYVNQRKMLNKILTEKLNGWKLCTKLLRLAQESNITEIFRGFKIEDSDDRDSWGEVNTCSV